MQVNWRNNVGKKRPLRKFNPSNISKSAYTKFADTLDETLKKVHTYLEQNLYTRTYSGMFDKGGAYNRYLLALKWAKEEIADEILKDELINL